MRLLRLNERPLRLGSALVLLFAAGCIDRGESDDASADATATDADPDPDPDTAPDPDSGPEPDTDPQPDPDPDPDPDPKLDPACGNPDPAVNAAWSIDVGDWLDRRSYELQVDVSCTVQDVTVAAGDIVTALDCDDEGQSHAVVLTIAAPGTGTPGWDPGEAVLLAYDFYNDTELDTGVYESVSLHRASDAALLVAAFDTDSVGSAYHAPLQVTHLEGYCGFQTEDDITPFAIEVQLAGADPLTLVDGQIGSFSAGDEAYAIDLAEATVGHCCHYATWYRLLIRRMR